MDKAIRFVEQEIERVENGIVAAAVMTGATAMGNGSAGYVTQPKAGEEGYFLRGDGTWQNIGASTSNYYLDGISKTDNTLTFSVNGASNPTYTFGSNAFNSTTIPTNNNQLTNGAGFITGNQTITLSNDLSGSGTTSISATIQDDAVTYAKMQNVSATDRVLGRNSSGAGVVEEITPTQLAAIVSEADSASDDPDMFLAGTGVFREPSFAVGMHGISDTAFVSLQDGQFLRYTYISEWNAGNLWKNVDLVAGDIPSLATSKITSGTFADALIAESNVTQHQAALSITKSQVSDFGTYDNYSSWTVGTNEGSNQTMTVGSAETVTFQAGTGASLSHGNTGSAFTIQYALDLGSAYLSNFGDVKSGNTTLGTSASNEGKFLVVTDQGSSTYYWDARVIAASDLPSASTSASGIVELATTAETTTGTDTARAVTPDGLKDGYQGSSNITTVGTLTGLTVSTEHSYFQNTGGNCNVFIKSSNSGNARLYLGDVADAGAGFIDYDNGTNMTIGTEGAVALTIDGSQNATFKSGSTLTLDNVKIIADTSSDGTATSGVGSAGDVLTTNGTTRVYWTAVSGLASFAVSVWDHDDTGV